MARAWPADREAELLRVAHYHVVFTLPTLNADIAYQNKAEIYAILFRAAAETLIAIAADPSIRDLDRPHRGAAQLEQPRPRRR